MKCYIISYDLKKGTKQDYTELYESIKSYPKWAHINESLWAIRSEDTAKIIRDFLRSKLDNKDSIFVIRSGFEAAWTTNIMCSGEWLKENL